MDYREQQQQQHQAPAQTSTVLPVVVRESSSTRGQKRRVALILCGALLTATSILREVATIRPEYVVSGDDDSIADQSSSYNIGNSRRSLEIFRNRSVASKEDANQSIASVISTTVQSNSTTLSNANTTTQPMTPTSDQSMDASEPVNSSIVDTVNAPLNPTAPSLTRNEVNETNTSTADAVVSNVTQTLNEPWAALCAVMRDEDLYISEWTDYHLALGFEHVFIYDSHPNFTLSSWYAQRQQREAEEEIPDNTTTNRVHLTQRVLPDKGNVQELVYGECLAQLRALPIPPKWVMVLDGDEYLVFRDMDRYPNVTTFLTDHLQSGSLQINWVVMGSANETQYRNEPVTQRFQLAVSGSRYHETKAVAILDHIDGWRVHYAYHKPGYKGIGMGGRKVGLAGALCCIKDGDVSVAAVFHYKFKSYGEFNHKQCERGDIYKKIKHSCPATVETGDMPDDSAWRALQRLVPKYAVSNKDSKKSPSVSPSADSPASSHILEDPSSLAMNATSVSTVENSTATIQEPWAALCAVMKDEDLYISEWTDYHLALGFEHIFIYDSHPNFTLSTWYETRQQKEAAMKVSTNSTTNRVHLTHRVLPDTGNVQELVYGECLEQLRALPVPPKWVMVLDGDEFLVFRDMDRHPNVTTFLTEHLQKGSLQINWVVMGSANETTYRDEPVTKRFQLAVSGPKHPQTKAVAILDHVKGWRVHYAYHKPGYGAIGMAGRKASMGGALCCIENGDTSVAAVFHYKFKSYGEFNHKQCERGDIYKKIKHSCPATVETGDMFDDSAWRAMTRLLPNYAETTVAGAALARR